MKTDICFRRTVILYPIILIVIFGLLFAWGYYEDHKKIMPVAKVDGLQLPEGATGFLGTRIVANDICWSHCVVEKVVRYEQGLEEFREYLKEHNTHEQLEGVNVCPFDVLDDMGHYCYDNLNEPKASEVREDGVEKYIIIDYWVYGAKGKSQWRLVD